MLYVHIRRYYIVPKIYFGHQSNAPFADPSPSHEFRQLAALCRLSKRLHSMTGPASAGPAPAGFGRIRARRGIAQSVMIIISLKSST